MKTKREIKKLKKRIADLEKEIQSQRERNRLEMKCFRSLGYPDYCYDPEVFQKQSGECP